MPNLFIFSEYVHISPEGDKSQKRKMTVCYTLFPPYVVNPMEPNPIGLDPELIRTLAKYLNIEVTFKFAKTFTDLIMFLLFGQADMAISQPNLVHPRYELGLDISPALTQRNFYFIVRHPVPVDSFYTVVYPFSNGVWAGTLASVILVACTLAILNK